MRRVALAAAVLAIAAGSSLLALRPVPFHASIDTNVAIGGSCGPACQVLNIGGSGQAAHMGRISIDGPSTANFATGVQTGTSTLTAADGSELEIEFTGTFRPTGPTDVTFSGSWTVISGTGRFTDADGGGAYHGAASLATSTGELFLDGTITDTGN